MINMISRFVGSLYLMFFPLKRPKLGNLVFTIIQAFSFYFVVLSHYFVDYAKLLMLLGLAGLGFGRASTFLPYLLAYKNLRESEDVVAVNIWQALTVLGYAFALLIDYFLSTVCH